MKKYKLIQNTFKMIHILQTGIVSVEAGTRREERVEAAVQEGFLGGSRLSRLLSL